MLPLLLAVSTAVSGPAPMFSAACRRERSESHCACVVDALAADPGGRFLLDMTTVMALPDADQMPGYAALLARHGVDAAGGSALRQRGQVVGDAAVARCK